MTVDYATGEIADSILNYEIHPIADCYPLIQGAEFEALVESIRISGQRVPVVLDKHGRLLDGRNRARACQALGIDVIEATYYGDDIQQYVLDLNEHRRHMDAGARALVAAKLANLTRGGEGGVRKTNGSVEPLVDETPISNEDAAKALDVSPSQVKRAKRVIREAPELIPDIESGALPIRTAENILKAAGDDIDRRTELLADHKAGKPIPKPQPDNRPPASPKYGPRRKHTQILHVVINEQLDGICLGLAEITTLDQSLTNEEAARLADDLSKQIRTLSRIKTLLKEHIK